jgi:hypothetical protein
MKDRLSIKPSILVVVITFFTSSLFADYPDQHFVQYADSLNAHIENTDGIILSDDGTYLHLADSVLSGYVIFCPVQSDYPFDRGLPSWNGTAQHNRSSFKIQMRFPYGGGWSPWLTVGFWKSNIWSTYGTTSYSGGEVDYDYVMLDSYQGEWQFKVIMKRYALTDLSPSIHKLSFFISDSRTTASINHTEIVNDNPEELFVDTDFLYQYAIDDVIGGSICSPTSVSMVLLSYQIDVDPLQFAYDTYDPYYGIFGMWPRVVQNASEYGLDGAVTRYRSWSETREVLAEGGRIVISVGPPLYNGHLMMLAGFTATGNPIIHDPARSNGYAYIFNKSDLGHSWFDKGGIAYTFYLSDTVATDIKNPREWADVPEEYELFQNYPNPFNPQTYITFRNTRNSKIKIDIFDITGKYIETLQDRFLSAGVYTILWDASRLPSGTYLIRMSNGFSQRMIKSILLK